MRNAAIWASANRVNSISRPCQCCLLSTGLLLYGVCHGGAGCGILKRDPTNILNPSKTSLFRASRPIPTSHFEFIRNQSNNRASHYLQNPVYAIVAPDGSAPLVDQLKSGRGHQSFFLNNQELWHRFQMQKTKDCFLHSSREQVPSRIPTRMLLWVAILFWSHASLCFFSLHFHCSNLGCR